MASKVTKAQLEALVEAQRAQIQGLQQDMLVFQRRLHNEYVSRDEYNRVQGVLRSTQQFLAKYKTEARGEGRVSERRAAMEAAKRQAIESGQTVAVGL